VRMRSARWPMCAGAPVGTGCARAMSKILHHQVRRAAADRRHDVIGDLPAESEQDDCICDASHNMVEGSPRPPRLAGESCVQQNRAGNSQNVWSGGAVRAPGVDRGDVEFDEVNVVSGDSLSPSGGGKAARRVG